MGANLRRGPRPWHGSQPSAALPCCRVASVRPPDPSKMLCRDTGGGLSARGLVIKLWNHLERLTAPGRAWPWALCPQRARRPKAAAPFQILLQVPRTRELPAPPTPSHLHVHPGRLGGWLCGIGVGLAGLRQSRLGWGLESPAPCSPGRWRQCGSPKGRASVASPLLAGRGLTSAALMPRPSAGGFRWPSLWQRSP